MALRNLSLITLLMLSSPLAIVYIVNEGVRFRQWANSVLKQYLVKGYAINENIRKQQIAELRQLVQVVSRTIQQQPAKSTDESNALTLMIAESKTEEKDIMVKVVVNLINQAN